MRVCSTHQSSCHAPTSPAAMHSAVLPHCTLACARYHARTPRDCGTPPPSGCGCVKCVFMQGSALPLNPVFIQGSALPPSLVFMQGSPLPLNPVFMQGSALPLNLVFMQGSALPLNPINNYYYAGILPGPHSHPPARISSASSSSSSMLPASLSGVNTLVAAGPGRTPADRQP